MILRSGDLGSAIRASMTVPLVFKPIEIDGVLLFDGGIVNNFPHDIMKELFKPDIIIGHQVTDDQKTANPDDVMSQISNLVMRPTNFEINEKEGILLKTKFKNVSLLDWNKADMIVVEGMKTAYNSLDSIKSIVKRRIHPEKVNEKRRQFVRKKPELFFQNIQVEGIKDPMQRKFIIQSIKGKDDVVTLESFKREYFKLIADEHIKSIIPVSQYNNETGYFDLHLKVDPQKKVEVKVGGNISTKPINQGFASFNYRTYKSRAYALSSNIYFGRFYSSFKLGARIDYPTSLPFYLAGYTTFNRWDYFASSSELFFEDVRPPYIIQYENNTRFEAGFPLKIHNKVFGGFAFSNSTDLYYQTDVFNKGDEPDKTTFNAFSSQIGIENNSLNYRQYASEGSNRHFVVKYISGKETNTPGTTAAQDAETVTKNHDYFQFEAFATRYFRLKPKFATGLLGEAVYSTKSNFNNFRSSKLAAPGFYPTPHSKSLFISNFHSNSYLAGGVSTAYTFAPGFDFRLEGYAFLPVKELLVAEDGTMQNASFIENYYLQGLAAIVYQTGVGPVSLTVNYYEKENTRFYVMLNFGYIIFNKRGF
jgi:NTE family protein